MVFPLLPSPPEMVRCFLWKSFFFFFFCLDQPACFFPIWQLGSDFVRSGLKFFLGFVTNLTVLNFHSRSLTENCGSPFLPRPSHFPPLLMVEWFPPPFSIQVHTQTLPLFPSLNACVTSFFPFTSFMITDFMFNPAHPLYFPPVCRGLCSPWDSKPFPPFPPLVVLRYLRNSLCRHIFLY